MRYFCKCVSLYASLIRTSQAASSEESPQIAVARAAKLLRRLPTARQTYGHRSADTRRNFSTTRATRRVRPLHAISSPIYRATCCLQAEFDTEDCGGSPSSRSHVSALESVKATPAAREWPKSASDRRHGWLLDGITIVYRVDGEALKRSPRFRLYCSQPSLQAHRCE